MGGFSSHKVERAPPSWSMRRSPGRRRSRQGRGPPPGLTGHPGNTRLGATGPSTCNRTIDRFEGAAWTWNRVPAAGGDRQGEGLPLAGPGSDLHVSGRQAGATHMAGWRRTSAAGVAGEVHGGWYGGARKAKPGNGHPPGGVNYGRREIYAKIFFPRPLALYHLILKRLPSHGSLLCLVPRFF